MEPKREDYVLEKYEGYQCDNCDLADYCFTLKTYPFQGECQYNDNDYVFKLKKEPEPPYDSALATKEHIVRVQELLLSVIAEISERGFVHDATKLQSPEKEIFDEFTPKLKNSVYGSEEYFTFLRDMTVALRHHYKQYSHHPEHYENGVDDMNLFDIVEMFFDWKASSERHTTGDIFVSIEVNKARFKMSEQLCNIFKNTAKNIETNGHFKKLPPPSPPPEGFATGRH